MLRSTGRSVQLKLVRYLHGFKFEQLQQAIANSTNPMASSYIRSNSSSNILQQPQDEDEEEVEVEELPPAPPVSLTYSCHVCYPFFIVVLNGLNQYYQASVVHFTLSRAVDKSQQHQQ